RSTAMGELERVASERRFEEVQGAGSNLWVLGTIGAAAPFIGLFGTVLGIIRAFHAIALAGTGGFAVVAAGISEALIATALGLAVGIIAVVFYNYFQSRVDRIDASLRIGSGRVLEAVSAGPGAACAPPRPEARHRGRDQHHAPPRRLSRPADHLHDPHPGHDQAGGRRPAAIERRAAGAEGRHGHDDAIARDLRERASRAVRRGRP